MDPNETLENLRYHIHEAKVCPASDALKERGHYRNACAYFEMLDEWLTKGGFLPNDWKRPDPFTDKW